MPSCAAPSRQFVPFAALETTTAHPMPWRLVVTALGLSLLVMVGCGDKQESSPPTADAPAKQRAHPSAVVQHEPEDAGAREATGEKNADAGATENNEPYLLRLRVLSRIPTVGYDSAFVVSLENRSESALELPEGTEFVFTFRKAAIFSGKPVQQKVALAKSYRVLPDSTTEFEECWVKIPLAGKLSVQCAISKPIAVKSSPISLEVERYLFYDANGSLLARPSEPGESEPPGEFLIEPRLPQNPDK